MPYGFLDKPVAVSSILQVPGKQRNCNHIIYDTRSIFTISKTLGKRGEEQPMAPGSRPQYRVLFEKDVPRQTRDGVPLRADSYRPDAPGRFPVLLSRLPYNKNLRPCPGDIDYFVECGYGVIMQDTCGRFSSDGDAYYALIWLARRHDGGHYLQPPLQDAPPLTMRTGA